MNKFIDLINRWAQKIAFRTMAAAGVSGETLNKYASAVNNRNDEIIKQDKELNKHHGNAKMIIYAVLILAAFILFKVLKRRKII